MNDRKTTAADLVERVLSDKKPRTSVEIVETIGDVVSPNAIYVALTHGAAHGRFTREKIDKKYVYGLPERAA